MDTLDNRSLKIIALMDADELVDVLELTAEDIVTRFADVIEEKIDRFEYLLGDLIAEEDDDETD